MVKYIRKLISENVLLKVTSVNSLAIFTRIVAGLITSKVVAFYVGPQGMAILGDLRNFLVSTHNISTLGITNGIVKYTAEFRKKNSEYVNILSTSFYLMGGASLLAGLIVFFGAPYWNELVFKGIHDFTSVFRTLGVLLPLFAANTFLVAIINGFGKYKMIVYLHVVANIVGMIVTVFLIYSYNIEGALYALIIMPSFALVFTFIGLFIHKSDFTIFKFTRPKWEHIKKLGSYSGMTLFSSIAAPWVYIAIRQHIENVDSLSHAGYWDAMMRISDYYMMFVMAVLTLYILPKLSEIQTAAAFRKEVFGYYKTILPLFALGLILVYLLRTIIIRLIFTQDFLEMEPIFIWQLLGDFARVASIVLGYQFIAKNMFWHFITTQIISLSLIYLTCRYFIDRHGFIGASMGHALSYMFHLCMMLVIFRKELFYKLSDVS